jgi:hypothetical protein
MDHGEKMTETRRIGRLTIHFLGDGAAQLGNSFDNSFSGSSSFRDAMGETARTYRHVYVGGSLENLRDQPDFDRAGFNSDSKAARNTNAFGKTAGPESYFIVVTDRKHHLLQDGKTFAGSTDLSLVHELLHPTQIIRELTETGHASRDSEARTQMREQKIAEELGKTPGKDFPDVLGSGIPYTVQLEPSEAPPPSLGDPALPVDPMKYGDRASLSPAQPISLPLADSSPVRRLVRVNGNAPATPAVSSDGRDSLGGLFENQTSSPHGNSPRGLNFPVSPPEAEMPIGIFSGKPMPLWKTPPPIFDTRDRSDAAGDQSHFTTLGDLLWGGGKPKASAFVPGAPAVPSVLDGEESFSNGAASPESSPGAGIVPPGWTAQQPQKSPASLLMDYIQRLKPLEATPSRASAFDTGALSVPFISPDGVTGALSGAASPTPPQQNLQGPLSLMDAYLEYRKQLDAGLPASIRV